MKSRRVDLRDVFVEFLISNGIYDLFMDNMTSEFRNTVWKRSIDRVESPATMIHDFCEWGDLELSSTVGVIHDGLSLFDSLMMLSGEWHSHCTRVLQLKHQMSSFEGDSVTIKYLTGGRIEINNRTV